MDIFGYVLLEIYWIVVVEIVEFFELCFKIWFDGFSICLIFVKSILVVVYCFVISNS